MTVKLTRIEKDGQIRVESPYNAEFVNKCRNLRGKFNKTDSCWYFDDAIEEYVKDALKECFGVDGCLPVRTCSLIITGYDDCVTRGPVTLFGRKIAKAFDNEGNAALGDGIILLRGSCRGSGSRKNWRTDVNEATFEMQDFILERTKFPDVQKAIAEGWCTIKEAKKKRPSSEIIEEINQHKEAINLLEQELNE